MSDTNSAPSVLKARSLSDAMSDEVDAEIEALIAVVKILAPFSDEERQRMLRYLRMRLLGEKP